MGTHDTLRLRLRSAVTEQLNGITPTGSALQARASPIPFRCETYNLEACSVLKALPPVQFIPVERNNTIPSLEAHAGNWYGTSTCSRQLIIPYPLQN